MIPDYLTHYYRDEPFRTLTELAQPEMEGVLAGLAETLELPRRLRSDFYFRERSKYEEMMHRQFLDKRGEPQRRQPHYLVLGESTIWAGIEPNSLQVPLNEIPSRWISFTYTDSWCAYVDRTLRGEPIPRKPQYEMVYRLEELDALIETYGWPGNRWESEPDWKFDVYIEAQVWCDEPLRQYICAHDRDSSGFID